ncbi:MAG: DUF2807 domain-containing protein [Bacteroidales bacterium]|nr:DUF2807 domain-containing protein [Bacteroidales bacterium]
MNRRIISNVAYIIAGLAICVGAGRTLTPDIVVQQVAVEPFSKIDINGIANVFLTQGDMEAVKVEADERLLPDLTIKNDGETLIIRLKSRVKTNRITRKPNIYITLRNIRELTKDGVGALKTQSQLRLNDVKISFAGVGAADLELSARYLIVAGNGVGNLSLTTDCDLLSVDHIGVGSLTLTGHANELQIAKNGTGSLNARTLIAQIADVKNNGVGSVAVVAQQKLVIKNTGIGSVYYSGNAPSQNISNTGIGKIKEE